MTQPSDTIKTWATDVGVRPPVAGASNVQAALAGLGAVYQDFVITEHATESAHTFPITAVDLGANTVTVAGDQTATLHTCIWASIEGSTGNDGLYGIIGSAYSSGPDATVVTFSDTLPDPTVDGDVKPPAYVAELSLPVGAVVLGVVAFQVAAWAADQAAMYVAEGGFSYVGGVILSGATDPVVGITLAAGAGSAQSGVLAGANNDPAAVFDLYVSILTTIAAPPVVPTGITRVRVWYAVGSAAPVVTVPFT